jgi:ferrochelatase
LDKKKIGLLVMAYGTPNTEEDIEPYYTHIRRGRPPHPDMLQDLKNRYEAIGGTSPLAKITREQADSLEKKLNECQNKAEFKVYIGFKHIAPFIEDAVTSMHGDGIKEAVSIVLAPHYSTFSVEAYNLRAKKQADKLGGLSIASIDSWYEEPKFLSYWINQIKKTYERMASEQRNSAVLIVSAHSLPEKIREACDPYEEQLKKTAELIAKGAGVSDYAIGWQSEGNTPDPWIGPDVQDLTRDLFKQGYRSFVYAPVGFVSDHLEVLYDNDVECKAVTDELGAAYFRPDMPNASPEFIEALADTVMRMSNLETYKKEGEFK